MEDYTLNYTAIETPDLWNTSLLQGEKMACSDVRAPQELSIFTAFLSGVFCLLTVVGNVLIVAAVIVDPLKKLRTPFNYFLVNLSVSDLVVGLIVLPVSVYVHVLEAEGGILKALFPLIHMTTFISTMASVFSLAALCLDRLAAITWPIKYRCRLSIRRCAVMSCFIWFTSLSLPWIYYLVGYIDFLMVFVHIAVVVTFTIMVVTYVRVYKIMRKQSREVHTLQRTTTWRSEINLQKSNSVEKKVTRAFLIILVLFMATYLPATAMIYVLQFCTECSCILRHVLRDLQFLLILSNSFMNPFVCAFRMRQFKDSIRCLITMDHRKRKQSNCPSSTIVVPSSGSAEARM